MSFLAGLAKTAITTVAPQIVEKLFGNIFGGTKHTTIEVRPNPAQQAQLQALMAQMTELGEKFAELRKRAAKDPAIRSFGDLEARNEEAAKQLIEIARAPPAMELPGQRNTGFFGNTSAG